MINSNWRKSLPASCLQMVENEEGLAQVLQQMGVQSGHNISFENFWTLINKQAVQLFGSTHKEKNTKCSCLLQWEPHPRPPTARRRHTWSDHGGALWGNKGNHQKKRFQSFVFVLQQYGGQLETTLLWILTSFSQNHFLSSEFNVQNISQTFTKIKQYFFSQAARIIFRTLSYKREVVGVWL